jgi:hypothetical protein
VTTNQTPIQRNLEAFEYINWLVTAQLFDLMVGILLDVDQSNIEIPAEIKSLIRDQLHIYTSAEAMVLLG